MIFKKRKELMERIEKLEKDNKKFEGYFRKITLWGDNVNKFMNSNQNVNHPLKKERPVKKDFSKNKPKGINRKAVMELSQQGHSAREVAEMLNCSYQRVFQIRTEEKGKKRKVTIFDDTPILHDSLTGVVGTERPDKEHFGDRP